VGVAPEIVVVSPETQVTALAMELTLELERVRVRLEHLAWPELPELLNVAERIERVALLEVVAQGRLVGTLAAAEVVGGVAVAFVQVREDDEARRVKIELLFFGRRVVESPGHARRYLAPELVALLLGVSRQNRSRSL